MTQHPHVYDLPHSEFRPHQLEAIQKYLTVEPDGVLIAQQPTGSGKSAVAMAVASKKPIIILTATKMLQDAYANEYSADIVKGKTNYKCVHPFYKNMIGSVSECVFSKVGMQKCPSHSRCRYVVARNKAMRSPKAVLNYHYYLAMKKHWPKPHCLILDEAHDLHKLVTDYVGCTITSAKQTKWGLPDLPIIEHHVANTLLRLPPPTDLALPWLKVAREVMLKHYYRLENKIKAYQDERRKPPEQLVKQFRDCYNFGRELRATIDALRSCADDWHVRSSANLYQVGVSSRGLYTKQTNRPKFVCRPLTARHHFSNYFLSDDSATIAMSATVGNMETFAEELGIESHDSLIVPNRFPPDTRPIHALDVPAMGSRATDADFEKQADEIAKLIKSVDSTWSGLIHVTRKKESVLLANRLAHRGLADRVWPFTGHNGDYRPTDKQVTDWHERLAQVPNSIGIGWSVMTGYDGTREKINILAKVPYPLWGSDGSYEAAWRSHSYRRYLWQAGCHLTQAAGRTRRGRDEDYDVGGEINGIVAIADGSWSRVKGQLSQDFLDSIVEA